MRIPYLTLLACSLTLCNATLAQPARRAQLTFDGTTSASEMLIRDVMRNVMDLGDEEFDCPMPDSVIADVLPADFQPADPATAPKGARKQVYERWTIDFCGEEVPFLLTFWTLEQGGTAFDLDYPFEALTTAMEEGGTRLQ